MLGQRKKRDGRSLDADRAMRRPANKYAVATAMLSSATPLFLGYDLAMVYSTAVMSEADLRLLASIVVLSSILGAVATLGAQCLIGDRRTVLLSAAVLCAGALARALASRFAAFTAGVFVNGVGMGLMLMGVPAYAAELCPSSVRGVLTSHPDGFVYLGCILGSLCYSTGFLKLPANLAWWLIVVPGTAVPALLTSAVLFLPESPRWLVAKDQVSKARRVLSRTSATLEEAELRLLEIKSELGAPHDVSPDEPAAMAATCSWWREERGILRELLARPTEPLRRALVSVVVAKVFQQASGIGSMLQYVRRAFRDAGVSSDAQVPRGLAAFGFVVVVSFSVSLVLVELGWLLVRALAGGCARRAPWHRRGGAGHAAGMTRRQEQLKWARGLSATMLVSLMALVWIALGPAEAPFGSKELWRNFIGIYSSGKVSQIAVWNKGTFNSKTEESFLRPFISRELKHPVGIKVFAEARGNEQREEERECVSVCAACLLLVELAAPPCLLHGLDSAGGDVDGAMAQVLAGAHLAMTECATNFLCSADWSDVL